MKIMPNTAEATTVLRPQSTATARLNWRKIARRAAICAACSIVSAMAICPGVSLAAESVTIGGTTYTAAASDDSNTWSWDGKDTLTLNGYRGLEISAKGDLTVVCKGQNTIMYADDALDDDAHDGGIIAECGTNEDTHLTITGEGDLTITSPYDAIYSQGDLTISGTGTVSATSTDDDGIYAQGNITIAKAAVIASGAGKEDNGIFAYGSATIKDGAKVTTLGNVTGINASSITIDASTLKATAVGKWPTAIYAASGDINISNGSFVEASANGTSFALGIQSTRDTGQAGGHIAISDSTVNATAQTTSTEDQAAAIATTVLDYGTGELSSSISITNSKVTAEGTTFAIAAANATFDERTPTLATITLDGCRITSPQDAKIAEYQIQEDFVDTIEHGVFVANADAGDEVITNADSVKAAAAKKVAIEVGKEPEPTPTPEPDPDPDPDPEPEPDPEPTPDPDPTPDTKPDTTPDTPEDESTDGKGSSKKESSGTLPQTGDMSALALVAATGTGAAMLAAGLVASRRRNS